MDSFPLSIGLCAKNAFWTNHLPLTFLVSWASSKSCCHSKISFPLNGFLPLLCINPITGSSTRLTMFAQFVITSSNLCGGIFKSCWLLMCKNKLIAFHLYLIVVWSLLNIFYVDIWNITIHHVVLLVWRCPFHIVFWGGHFHLFPNDVQKKGYHRFIKSLGQNTFQIKIAYPNCWMPDLHKYRVMNIVFIYLVLGLIIGVKNLRDMCHLVYGQFDLEPLQFKVG